MNNEIDHTWPLQSKQRLVIPLIVLFIFSLSITGFFAYQNYKLRQIIKVDAFPWPCSPAPTSIPATEKIINPKQEIDTQSYLENTEVPGQKRFTSPRLGISFLYLGEIKTGLADPQGKEITTKMLIKEIGNKVYIYGEGNSLKSGQDIEVFQKNKEETFKEALERTFLQGDFRDNCFIESNSSALEFATLNIPKNYEIASIKMINRSPNLEEFLKEVIKKCPFPYTETNGISYFLYDPDHPDKFVFFNLGQYSINAVPEDDVFNEEDVAWNDTINFLD